jgi:hypothetical protein
VVCRELVGGDGSEASQAAASGTVHALAAVLQLPPQRTGLSLQGSVLGFEACNVCLWLLLSVWLVGWLAGWLAGVHILAGLGVEPKDVARVTMVQLGALLVLECAL